MTEDAVQEIPAVWVEAWECYQKHLNRRDTMKELRIGAAVLRRRLNGYSSLTGVELPAPRQKPPPPLTKKHIDTWDALARLGTYADVAIELGIHLNSVRHNLKQYRRHKGLPDDARPVPKTRNRKTRKQITVDERLDVMLVALECAEAAGDRALATTLRAGIHAIERRHYGRGLSR